MTASCSPTRHHAVAGSYPRIALQVLEEENKQQLAMIMSVVSRVEILEQQVYAIQEERERQRNSRWGMFSLQAR